MSRKKRPIPKPSPSSSKALSPGKRLLFRGVALLLPLVFLALLEVVLRLFGLGGNSPMLQRVGPVEGGTLVVAEQGGAASWFFASPDRAGRNEFSAFLDPKPANTVRVFCVGESAMQGFPQPRHLASSAFLQAMLQDVLPARSVEVINLGTTAIASFPVLGIMTEALEFQPDLMVIYTGNNEFFGTYGVASSGRAGSKPWLLRANRWLNSLALVQGLRRVGKGDGPVDRPLMEAMMARSYIGPHDWRRRAAADNLYANVAEMIRRCQARGVPVLVCTLPLNEQDLAPIGADKLDHLPNDAQQAVKALLESAERKLLEPDSNAAVGPLQTILEIHPEHARAHYLLGKCFVQLGKTGEARAHFEAAANWDPMPWRPPARSQAAVVRAAHDLGASVCDLLQAFRNESPDGLVGWELMDDHVHPNLRGQALIAESILNALTNFSGAIPISPAAVTTLPAWTNYAQRLGENIYDRYGVAHKVRMLFDAQFMRANNPDAFTRFDRDATAIESKMSAEVRAVLHEWQVSQPFAGSRCPVTAAVAQLKLKQDDYQTALDLYEMALRAVPPYTSWHLEYTYYVLYCRQKLHGQLTATDRSLAQAAVQQGSFLARHGSAPNEFVDRYTGLLCLLRHEFAEAIPYLESSRARLGGLDLLATEQALVLCYLQTRQFDQARKVAGEGAARGNEYSARYRALLDAMPALEEKLRTDTNSTWFPPG